MDKQTQRKIIWDRLKTLSEESRISSDHAIARAVLSLPEYQNAGFLFCFVSMAHEIDTTPILQHAWASGKRIAVPKCIRKGVMELFEIHSFDDLVTGSFGILEPKDSCSPVSASSIDFAVVPCLSCDRKRNRLGHGGGYYDRYLESATFVTAALCRESLMLDAIITEPHDQPVDLVISERAVYR